MKENIFIRSALSLLLFFSTVNCQFYFASLSNYGCSLNQHKIARQLEKQAELTPYSLLVSPGNNFPSGLDFEKCFKNVYNNKTLQIPFLVTMGDADWENGSANELFKENNATYNVEKNIYPKFTFPNYYYHHVSHYTDTSSLLSRRDGSVLFVFIDTFLLSAAFPDNKFREEALNTLNETLQYGKNNHDFTIIVGYKYMASAISIDNMLKKVKDILVKNQVDLILSSSGFMNYNSTINGTLFLNCNSYCSFKVNGDSLTPYIAKGGELVEMNTIKTKLPSVLLSFQGVSGDGLPSNKLIDLPFKKGAKHLSRDAFMKVVGTIGLMILSACLTTVVINKTKNN